MLCATTTRAFLIAVTVGSALYGGTVNAQVKMFDTVPTQDQLRNILIPDEPVPSASRSITIAKPNVEKAPSSVQSASMPSSSASSSSVPAPSAQAPSVQTTATQQASSDPSKEARRAPGKQDAEKTANAVAFHVNFPSNSSVIPQDSIPYLNAMADLLKQERKLTISVEGHTDASGSADYNLDLSKRRAQSVAVFLAHQGVSADQLMPIGKGKSEPLSANPYDSRNRRVQFKRLSADRDS
jgi:OOP family OmpA-OmpF porin